MFKQGKGVENCRKIFGTPIGDWSLLLTTLLSTLRTTRKNPDTLENLCLIRAGDNKTKLSTVISNKDVSKRGLQTEAPLEGDWGGH